MKEKTGILNQLISLSYKMIILRFVVMISLYVPFKKKCCYVYKIILFIIYAYLYSCSSKTNTNNRSGFRPLLDSVPTAVK